MAAICCGSDVKFEGLSADYKRRLWIVIAINAAMFFVEMGAGALAGSCALQADALDFLGVWGTVTKWPDLIVAAIMAGLFLTSSFQILRQSLRAAGGADAGHEDCVRNGRR